MPTRIGRSALQKMLQYYYGIVVFVVAMVATGSFVSVVVECRDGGATAATGRSTSTTSSTPTGRGMASRIAVGTKRNRLPWLHKENKNEKTVPLPMPFLIGGVLQDCGNEALDRNTGSTVVRAAARGRSTEKGNSNDKKHKRDDGSAALLEAHSDLLAFQQEMYSSRAIQKMMKMRGGSDGGGDEEEEELGEMENSPLRATMSQAADLIKTKIVRNIAPVLVGIMAYRGIRFVVARVMRSLRAEEDSGGGGDASDGENGNDEDHGSSFSSPSSS